MMMEAPLPVEVYSVSLTRGGRQVLDGVCVALAPGEKLTVELDGKERPKRTVDRPPTSRCSLCSKEADSKVLFDDFEARP
jgi:hypothetical protein